MISNLLRIGVRLEDSRTPILKRLGGTALAHDSRRHSPWSSSCRFFFRLVRA